MAYVRNTNVLRTEIETADGRFEIFDFAPRHPAGPEGRRADRDLPPAAAAVAARRGSRVHFDPRPDYARANVEIVAVGSGPRGGRRADAPVPVDQRARAVRASTAAPIRDRSADLLLAERRQAARHRRRRPTRRRALEQTIRGWRAWAKTSALPSFAPEVGAALGAVPEAARLQRHRRDHRRRDDQHSRSARLGPHLGLPLLLAARRGVRRRGAAPVEPPGRRRGVRALPARHGRRRPAAADVRHHRQARSPRGDRCRTCAATTASGPVRIGNAAYVQRQHDVDGEMVLCLETILTDPRVVWEDPTLAPLLERLVDEAMASFDVDDTGLVGIPHAAAALHLLEGDVLGRRASRRRARRRFSACPNAPRDGRRGPTQKRRDHSRPRLQQGARLLHAGVRRRLSRRLEPAAAGARPDRSARSALHVDGARLRAGARAARPDAALQARSTTSATRPARFRSARSGGSRRWR